MTTQKHYCPRCTCTFRVEDPPLRTILSEPCPEPGCPVFFWNAASAAVNNKVVMGIRPEDLERSRGEDDVL